MPDESTNPVWWTAQTSQDNQVITNQSWEDFVLDFWEWENKEKIESSEAESHNLEGIEQEKEEEMVSTNIDLNDINLFNEEEEVKNEDSQNNDIKIEDEKENEWAIDDDFNISLDDNLNQENNEDVLEQESSLDSNEIVADENNEINNENEWMENNMGEEELESEENLNRDNPEEEKLNLDGPAVAELENNLENEENSTDELLLGDNKNGDMNVDFDNEQKDDENINFNDEEQVDKVEDEIKDIDESDDSVTLDDDQEIEDNENYNERLEDDTETKEDDEINFDDYSEVEDKDNKTNLSDDFKDNEDWNIISGEWENDKVETEDFWDNVQEENLNENNDETRISDDENEFSYDSQEDSSDDNENEVKMEQESDEIDSWNVESEFGENPSNVNYDSIIDDESAENEKIVNQPEIWDLLWDAPVDFSEEAKDNIETQNLESNNEPANLQEDINNMPENLDDKDSDNQTEKNDDAVNNAEDEKQSFTLDYQEETQDNSDDNMVSEVSNEIVEWNKSNQIQGKSDINPENQANEIQANLVNDATSTTITNENIDTKVQNSEQENNKSLQESVDWIAWQQIKSTLSLDQILDSELTDNPQFSDNSKAVPTNVAVNWSNKKIIWIIACLWLFILAGIVAVLAFPSKNDKTNENTDTQIVEEYDPLHQSPTQPEGETTWQSVTIPHTVNPTIQQDFPEADTEEEQDIRTEEEGSWEPAPYTCEWDECFEELVTEEEEDNKLDIETIKSVVSDFKSQAEVYYSEWDDRQDKKLIRYAAQAINLCESYQAQIEKGEWIDEESFESFKSKIRPIISKITEYLGWENDVQDFVISNFNDEYDFPGKEEHKEFIYDMANS